MKPLYEIVIRGGHVYDGTGNPYILRDIGVTRGRIAAVGANLEGERVMKVAGHVVCPGFIDLHNHVDHGVLAFPDVESYIMQGVTTSLVGNCGLSMAPVRPARKELTRRYLTPFLRSEVDYGWDWATHDDYFRKIERNGVIQNLAALVGHGTIRIAVKGFDPSPPTPEEMEEMKGELRQALDGGAFGMSSGLIYPPGSYATSAEIEELVSALTPFKAMYATHMRNESDGLLDAVREATRVGERNGIPVEISHLKAMGRKNWGKVRQALDLMEEARERGVEVHCDAYPYTAGMTTITALLPARALEGGIDRMMGRLADPEEREALARDIEGGIPGWENWIMGVGWEHIVLGECPAEPGLEGLSLEEVFRKQGQNDRRCHALFDLLLHIRGEATMMLFAMDEVDVRQALLSPLSVVVSDSWAMAPRGGGKPHPRAYGSFPRFLRRYALEEKAIPLEEAIRKITSLPASRIGLQDRGLIREGFWADLVIFDPKTIGDQATFADPHQYPLGIRAVLVNGEIVVETGVLTGKRPGKVLRRGQKAVS
jgi:N-acyl-D-amino-acid deacylase